MDISEQIDRQREELNALLDAETQRLQDEHKALMRKLVRFHLPLLLALIGLIFLMDWRADIEMQRLARGEGLSPWAYILAWLSLLPAFAWIASRILRLCRNEGGK